MAAASEATDNLADPNAWQEIQNATVHTDRSLSAARDFSRAKP
jgi:hypothetical protein